MTEQGSKAGGMPRVRSQVARWLKGPRALLTVAFALTLALALQVASAAGVLLALPQIVAVDRLVLNVAEGTADVFVVGLSPLPTAPGLLQLQSSFPSVATVPLAVRFEAGQATVAIPVKGESAGAAYVTVFLNGSARRVLVQVIPVPSRIDSLAPQQLSVRVGAGAALTVTLAPANMDTARTVQLTSSDTTRLTVPASVTVPAGKSSASFTAVGLVAGAARVTARIDSRGITSTASSELQVLAAPSTLVSLQPATRSIEKGGKSLLRVAISRAQATVARVDLKASAGGIVNMPSQVDIPAGQTEVTFPVEAVDAGNVMVSASLAGAQVQAAVQVLAVPSRIDRLSPGTVTLALSVQSQLTAQLSTAPAEATALDLSTEPPGVVQVPAQAAVAAGADEIQVPVTALAQGEADVVARLNGSVRRSRIVVVRDALRPVALAPSSLALQRGASAQLAVRLGAAQSQAVTLALRSSRPEIVRVPDSITLAAGVTEQSFSVAGLATGTSQVLLTFNGSTASATVTVAAGAPQLSQAFPSTQDLPKGKLGTVRLLLDRAGVEPSVITLSVDRPELLQAPPLATVPAGGLGVDVPVVALQPGRSSLQAGLAGKSVAAAVQVVEAEVMAIAVSPNPVSVSPGQAAQARAMGTYSDASTRDITSGAGTAWGTAPGTVAKVAQDGRVTGLQQGEAVLTALQSVVPTWGNPQASAIAGTATVNVSVPKALAVSASRNSLVVGESAVVVVTTPYPVGAVPVVLRLSVTGTGGMQVPATLTIAPGTTSITGTVTATVAGSPVLQVAANGMTGSTLGFTVLPAVARGVSVTAITPASGPPGTEVTLVGGGFQVPASSNTVVFTAGVPAPVLSGSATQLTVRVPDTAQTGPLTVSNALGSAASPVFTVVREQDFGLVASPALLKVVQASNAAFSLRLASGGTRPFQGMAKLSVSGLPAGVQASFEPATLSAYQDGKLVLRADATSAPGTASLVLRAEAQLDGLPWVRESRASVEVLAKAGLTGVKGRFVTPEGAGIAGVIVRQDTSTNQVVSDAAGNFLITGLAPGANTLRFDATPANSLYPIWPYSVTVPAGQVVAAQDWVISPPPVDQNFKAIDNASRDQLISDARFPGFSVVLPAGASIVGWDGVQKTRIAVERRLPGQLPVGAPPFVMKEAFQLYFGTPMGGIPSQPIPVTLPNVSGRDPGEQVEIWWFDGSPMGGSGEWKMAGMGTVSPDGTSVASNPGVGIPRFCGVCGLVSLNCPPPPIPPQPPPCDPCSAGGMTAGNPINVYTGQEHASREGLGFGGLSPIRADLKYNPVDAFNNRAGTITSFGYGWTLDLDVSFLPFAGPQKRLMLPGGKFVNLVDDGTGKYRPADDPLMAGMFAQTNAAGEWELVHKGGMRWSFQPFAGITGVIRGGAPLFLTRVTDANGNVSNIARQSNGRITSVSSSGGRALTFDYGANGFVKRVTDHTGRHEDYEYTDSSRVSKVLDAMGRLTEYTYKSIETYKNTTAGSGTVSVQTACEGAFQANFEGLLTVRYPEASQPTVNVYGADRILRQVSSSGEVTTFSYKRQGACVAKLYEVPFRSSGLDLNYRFTCLSGQSLASGDALAREEGPLATCPDVESEASQAAGWRFYGGTVTETQVKKADGSTRTIRFNARGVPVEGVDGLGQVTRYSYDGKQQLVRVVDPLGNETRHEYDAIGNRVATIDALGHRTETSFDAQWNKPLASTGFLLGVPSVQGGQPLSYTPVVRSVTLDARGNPVLQTDPTGMAARFDFDPRGQLSRITFPSRAASVPVVSEGVASTIARGARTLALTYNAAGDMVGMTDAQGNERSSQVDALGRRIAETDALGFTSTQAYNAVDQPTVSTDPLQQSTRLVYDAVGRLASVVNAADAAVETYAYDANGRVSTTTDALGASSSTSYDTQARPVRLVDRKGQVTNLSYDARGALIAIDKPGHRITFQYDAAGRLVEVRDNASVTATQYDAAGRVVQVDTTTAAGSHRLGYDYDSLDRITRRVLSGSGIAVPEETIYSWDLAGRILSHTTTLGGHPHQVRYEWDAAGRLAACTTQDGPGIPAITQRYGYDALERLSQIRYLKAEGGSAQELIEQIDYSYDAAGQRIGKRALNAGGMGGQETPMAASYDAANRLTGLTLGIDGTSKRYALDYDANGNMTRKVNTSDSADATTYSWDADNRLVGIAQPGLTASFTYDALGRRIQSSIARTGQPAKTVQYLYEGAQALGEIRDGSLSHRLLTGLELDETLARVAIKPSGEKDTANSRTYMTDALNSVLAQLAEDGTGAVRTAYGYSPYGESLAIGPDATGNPIQYTSRENDGTGLYFYRARYYDTVLKRFVQEDPIGLNGGINRFVYVSGNPLSYVDPDGQFGLLGGLVGGGLEIGKQILIDGKSARCVNIGSVLTSAAFAAVSPGLITLGKSAMGKALPAAIAGLGFKELAITQGLFTGTNTIMKKAVDEKPWTIGDDCECK